MDKEKENTREDFRWLLSLFPKCPDIKILETTTQAISLLAATNRKDIPVNDIVKLSLGGLIAARARMMDENRFLEIPPPTYYMVAQYLMERDYNIEKDTEENFKNFFSRIMFS